ncbi:MAG: amidohydrolase family protein [Bdellovibrionales bacterium]
MKNILFLVIGSLSLISCSTGSKITSPLSLPSQLDFPIIDVHTHTRFDGKVERSSKMIMTEEQYFKEFKEAGVRGAISHTEENGAEFVDLRSKNVFHCFGLSSQVPVEKLEASLKSGKYRCIKIYLGYVHQYAYSKNYEPAYALAEKYQVPVVFHTGDTYSTKGKLKYADPLTIDEVAVDHPKVNFVIAHCGNPWIQSAAEVAYKNPNVYLDGSALLVGDLSETDPEKIEEYVIKPIRWVFGYLEDPTKLMFGTDWPLTHIKPYRDAFLKAIPKEHWRAVFYENAKNVFKFPDLEKKE